MTGAQRSGHDPKNLLVLRSPRTRCVVQVIPGMFCESWAPLTPGLMRSLCWQGSTHSAGLQALTKARGFNRTRAGGTSGPVCWKLKHSPRGGCSMESPSECSNLHSSPFRHLPLFLKALQISAIVDSVCERRGVTGTALSRRAIGLSHQSTMGVMNKGVSSRSHKRNKAAEQSRKVLAHSGAARVGV